MRNVCGLDMHKDSVLHSLNLVVGVGHALTASLLEGEQIGQVEVDAVQGRSPSLVYIVGPPVTLVDGVAVQGLAVVLLPLCIFTSASALNYRPHA